MSKLGLKRAPRITVETAAGAIQLRPLTAVDLSSLVKEFDMETVELAILLVNHHKSGKPLTDLFTDPTVFLPLIDALPDLIVAAINLCAGGDDEDEEAIRELPAEDIGTLTARLVAHSLERIGGLGKFLDLLRTAMEKINESFEAELRKNAAMNSSSESGATSLS